MITSTEDKVKNAVQSVLCIGDGTVAEINSTANFVDDLGADSLDVVEIQFALEEEFSVALADSEITKLQNVEEIVKFLENERIAQ